MRLEAVSSGEKVKSWENNEYTLKVARISYSGASRHIRNSYCPIKCTCTIGLVPPLIFNFTSIYT